MVLYYLLRWVGLVGVGLLVYGQTFGYGFVFDDYIFVVTNPFIKNFTNFPLMWQNFPMTRFLGMFSFSLNYHFNQLDPTGYHIFNFLVHMGCVALVWGLASLIFKITASPKESFNKDLPFIVALIFLVHPCQTQAVTYIAQRFESMATFFYLATVYCYLSARMATTLGRRMGMFFLAALAIFLGILTKEVFITVPVMILVCEWILFPVKRNLKLYLMLIAGGAVLSVVFLKLVHSSLGLFSETIISESHDGDVLNFGRYLLTEMRVFLTFLRLLILPIHQNVDYDYPMSTGLLHPPLTLVGLIGIAGLVFLIIKLRRRSSVVAFGLAWMLVTFSINLAPRSNVIFEHKLYLISFGFILAFVTILSKSVPERSTFLKIASCLVVVLAFSAFQRNQVWANELLLWQDGIKNSPNKARVNGNLGRLYGSSGQYDKSIAYLSRSIALSPDNITFENRGVIYSMQGRMDLALNDLNHSINMDKGYFLTYIKRAWVYHQMQNDKAALADLAIALQIDPYYPDSYIERGMILAQEGNNSKAFDDFQRALKIDPFNAQAKQGKAYCLSQLIAVKL